MNTETAEETPTTELPEWRKRLGEVVNKKRSAGFEITKASLQFGGRDYISHTVNGKTSPSVDRFLEMCEVIGADPAWVIGGDKADDSERARIAISILDADPKTLSRVRQQLDWAEEDQGS